MAGEQIIRHDVVQLDFITDLKKLVQLNDQVDDLKKKLGGGVGDEAFDDLKKSAEQSKKPLENLKQHADKLNASLTNIGKKGAVLAFNGLKKVAGVSFKALTAGLGAATTAIGTLVATSSSAYADYEQLVGGVDTLFKKSSPKVQEYANNAYKTAGISANKYMETVTSFSASMIQSVGGDTAKAADLSNMALTDMSDNANKMGTSMDSIIETYQSLARGNYMMLDNLKLGYGGTKEELKRLVNDASKMDLGKELGIKSGDISFANITKAIHVIQENMDITGTTAKEAEGTITGSLSAVKATWQNLMPALILGGDSFDQCLDNFIKAASGFGENIIPTIQKALVGVGKLVENIAPIIEKEFPKLVDDLLPPLLSAATSLLKALIKALPSIVKTIVKELPDILKGVGEAIVEAFGGDSAIVGKFGEALMENAQKVAKVVPVIIGLVAAFKMFSKVQSFGSTLSGLFGGGKSKGNSGASGGGLLDGIKQFATAKPTTILKGMANLAIVFGGFMVLAAVFMKVAPYMAKLSDMKSVLEVLAVVSLLGLVSAGLANVASAIGKIPVSTVAKGLANMAIMIAGMSALVMLVAAVALIKFDYVEMLKLVGVIGVLGAVGAALSVFAGIAGVIPVATVALGLANMAIIIAGMTALVLLIGAASLLDFDYKRILQLTGLIGVLGTVGAALSIFAGIVGMIPIPIVLAGLANMALVLGGVTLLILAFGKLSQIKGFNEFITKGGETLANLFNVIGKIVGSLIGGVGEGLTNSLPKIGENLSAFATSLKPMFEMFNGVDMGGVGEFFSAIGSFMLKMSGTKILEFFGGKTDFSGVAEGLKALTTEGVKNFFVMVNGIDAEAFTKGKKFFECLDGISALPNTGGIGQLFSGENDFSGVASGLKTLASDGVKKFFVMVSKFDETAFTNAEKFFKSLDGISELPNVGGLGQLFSGKNDFSGVANGLKTLSGKGVKAFFAMVSGLDESVFEKTKSLFNALADIGKVGEEGFWSKVGKAFSGDKDEKSGISKIASQLSSFAEKTAAFFTQVNSLNLKNLNGLWKSLEKAGELTTDNLGSVIDKSIDTLVEKISKLPKKMGDALKNNSKGLSDGFVSMWKEAVKASVAPVNKLLDGANHILKEFGSKKRVITWKPYAKGTDGHTGGNALVNDGRGAELVQMPNGRMFIPNGRNVFIPNAPKGMKVMSAERTANLFGKSSPTFRYAEGIGDIDIWSYADNAAGLVKEITKDISYDGMSGFASSLGQGMVTTFSGEMSAWIDKLFEEEGARGLASYVASKGVSQWRSTVIRALKMEGQYSEANVRRTLYQMQTESGGNPYAINLWDSNAKRGIPSKGLMQCIDPTFNAYARNGYDKNIYDPLSNILASVRYAVSRYGSLSKAYRGVGYANGVGEVKIPSQPSPTRVTYTRK